MCLSKLSLNSTQYKLICNKCLKDLDESDSSNDDENTYLWFSHNPHNDINYLPPGYISVYSPEQSAKIKDLIQQAFELDITHEPRFKSMVDADEWFTKKLSYCYQVDDLLQFQHPFKPSAGIRKSGLMYEIAFSMSDIQSIMWENNITPSAINFCLQCLNFYVDHTTSKLSAPKVIFGTIMDSIKVVPSKKEFPEIYTHLDVPLSDENNIAKKKCVKSMKEWYTNHDKGFLTLVMDSFTHQEKAMRLYTTIIPLRQLYYATLLVEFNPNNPYCCNHTVKTSDLFMLSKSEVQNVSAWYAKYFGLWTAENVKITEGLERNDFDCNDVKVFLSEDNTHYEIDDKSSILAQKRYDPPKTIEFDDPNNSGLYSLFQCVTDITGELVMKQHMWDKKQELVYL